MRIPGGDARAHRGAERVRDLARTGAGRVGGWFLAAAGAWMVLQWLLPVRTPIGIVAQGVVLGGLSALLAMGIVLVYRTNRIISFAQGELGGAAAVAVVLLTVVSGLPYYLAVLIGLSGAALIGATIEVGVIRRFADAPRLLPTVATIGLAQLLGFVTLILPVVFGGRVDPSQFRTPLSDLQFRIEPLPFDGNAVLVILVVTVTSGGLAWFFGRTRWGVALRAAAENAERAALVGIPTARLSTFVWALAGLLSGLAAVLQAPVVGLSLGRLMGPSLLVKGLAAAVIGRMRSLPVTVAAAIALSVVEQSVFWAYSRSSVTDALLVAVILGGLLLQRAGLGRAERSAGIGFRGVAQIRPIPVELRGLPEVRSGRWVLLAAGVAVAVLYPLTMSVSRASLLAVVVIYAIVALSLVVLTGWAGQVSLGQFALVGVGAATAGSVTTNLGVDFFVALAVGAGAGMMCALLLGLPALRLTGFYLAVTTLAFSVASSSWLFTQRWFAPNSTRQIERPVLFGRIDLGSEHAYYYLCLAVLAVVVILLRGLRQSRIGRAIVAVRDNAEAAQAYGANATLAKLAAFAISGGVAGLAGALLVHQQFRFIVQQYSPADSLQAFAMTVIGGLGSVPGALVGALYVKLSQNILQGGWALLATGMGMTFVLLVLPEGLGSLLFRARDTLLRTVADRRGIAVPSLIRDGAEGPARSPSGAPVHTPRSVVDEPAGVSAVAERGRAHRGEAGDDGPDEAVPAGDVLLTCSGLEVRYGQVQVLFGVDLHVRRGEILALLGTNGAGKSTLLKAIVGSVPPADGRVVYDGTDITGTSPQRTLAAGIVYMPGGKAVFPSLTVRENLRAAVWSRHRDPDVGADTEAVLDRFPRLRERLDQPAGNLSGGEQQMLALSMAFLGRPTLLMIDELSLGLAPAIVEQLLDIVRDIHRNGTTVVIVEQSVNVALTIAGRAVFLEKGEVRFEGATADLLDRPDVLRSVFLDKAATRITGRPDTSAAGDSRTSVLVVEDLVRSFGGITAVDHVNLELGRGEILGIIGSNGAGKTTLFDLISGFLAPDQGRILLGGVDVTAWGPDSRARMGLGRSFQDARLFPTMTVREAIAFAHHRHLRSKDLVSAALGLPDQRMEERLLRERTAELIELTGLTAYSDKFVGELSTGTRRMVDLACALAQDPDVLLLDEPSSGIAQRETEALGPLLGVIREVASCSILIIEHDMPLITSVSDRLVALELGRVIAEGPPAEVIRSPAVIASYLGTDRAVISRSGASADAATRSGNADADADVRPPSRRNGRRRPITVDAPITGARHHEDL